MAAPVVFHFTTDIPVVKSIEPDGNQVPPTTAITVTFGQPMDAASLATAMRVTTQGQTIAGRAWSDDARTLVFQPAANLPLGQKIDITIGTEALAMGSQAGLKQATQQSFSVVPYPAIKRTVPADGNQNAPIDDPVQVFFTAPVLPDSIKLTISPPVSATQVYSYYNDYDNSFTTFFPRDALSAYTVTLAAGISDPYGNLIDRPVVIRFVTGERRPTSRCSPGGDGHLQCLHRNGGVFQQHQCRNHQCGAV